jgi:serine/threonine protein kinase
MLSRERTAAALGGHGTRVFTGRYRVIRRLGTGGMASVYLAEDDRLGRRVAVKRLHTTGSEESSRRFAREARLGASLNHPNLVAVYDAISDEDEVLIVMEYVDGEDLGTRLRSDPPFPDETLAILRAVASALDHAHAHGIIHRDVKPSNILISHDGHVKLADLGVARALEDTAITGSGVVLGTLQYIAPEALRGEELCPPSDIYSLGLIAFELMSGRKGRLEGTVAQLTHRAINDPPPDLTKARPGTPPAAAAILRAALDPDPSKRPGSASAFVRDLGDALRHGPASHARLGLPAAVEEPPRPAAADTRSPPAAEATPPRPRARPDRRRRVFSLLATVVMLGAIAVVALAVTGTLSGGNGPKSTGSRSGAGSAATPHGGSGPAATGTASSVAAGSASPSSSPDATVEAFYKRAAAGDYGGAWSLADANLRAQLGGLDAFRTQQSTLESIEFPRITATSQSSSTASVSFSTVARHTSFTDRCTGSMSLIASGGGWLIDQAHDISCDRSST